MIFYLYIFLSMYKQIIISLILLFNITNGIQTSSITCVRYAINMSDINILNNNTNFINKCCYNNIVKKKCNDLNNFNKFIYYKHYCNYYEYNEKYTSMLFNLFIWIFITYLLYKY